MSSTCVELIEQSTLLTIDPGLDFGLDGGGDAGDLVVGGTTTEGGDGGVGYVGGI